MLGIVKVIGQHARFAYSLSKIAKQPLTNCYPLFQRCANSVGQYQDSLWDYYSFYKVLKPFIKKDKALKKCETWTLEHLNQQMKVFLLAFKKVSDFINFFQYNRFLLSLYQRCGGAAPFSDTWLEELENFEKNLVLFKTYLKGISFFKTKHDWENIGRNATPFDLTIKKWDYIQTGLLFGAGIISSVLWANTIAQRFFPVLGTFRRTCHIAEFAIFTLKISSVAINTHICIKHLNTPKAAPA